MGRTLCGSCGHGIEWSGPMKEALKCPKCGQTYGLLRIGKSRFSYRKKPTK